MIGGGYPGEAVAGGYVEDLAIEEGLFAKEEGFGQASIVSPVELEMLEWLYERGEDIADLLKQWKTSGLRNVFLWNFFTEEVLRSQPISSHADGPSLRAHVRGSGGTAGTSRVRSP